MILIQQNILIPIIVLIVVVAAAALIAYQYQIIGKATNGFGPKDLAPNKGLPPSKPKLPCSYIGLEVCGNSVDEDCDGTSQKCACSDGIDNDKDTYTDFNGPPNYNGDPGCASLTDDSELGTVQCDNGIDDDSDQNIDYPRDIQCARPQDNSEAPGQPDSSCSDTDGGINKTVKGTISGYTENGNSYSSTDYCTTDTCAPELCVREYFCDGPMTGSQELHCDSGTACIDGACK